MGLEGEKVSIDAEIRRINSLPIVRSVLEDLERELPANLKYHTAEHVREVLQEAIRFAVTDGIGGRELELLGIAAAYHDSGFLRRYEDNEEIGAELAEQAMRRARTFGEEEITLVREMILDTRVINDGSPYSTRASSELSKYLLDADLSNFGREDFFEKLLLVEEELGKPHREHLEQTYRLFHNHRWLTPAAKQLRSSQKEINEKKLKEMLG